MKKHLWLVGLVENKTARVDKVVEVLGSTTARGNLGTRIYEDGHLVRSIDQVWKRKKYEDPQGIMRALAGLGDFLTGDLFDFDRRTDRGNVFETRIVQKKWEKVIV